MTSRVVRGLCPWQPTRNIASGVRTRTFSSLLPAQHPGEPPTLPCSPCTTLLFLQGGGAALVGAVMLGPRLGRFSQVRTAAGGSR